MPDYDPRDWYWAVGGATDKVFSSARAAYVPVADDAYKAHLKAGGRTTAIDTEANLDDVLRPYGLSLSGPVRSATGYALVMALTDDQRALYGSVKPWDQRRLSLRGSDHIPEDNPLVARVAVVLRTGPKAWFDAALGVCA